MTELRRVVVHKAGGYDRLKVESGPLPAPRAGEVRVANAAVGVNYADCVVRMGLYESAKKYVGWPITPGFEFAGRVDAVGEGVADFAKGDEVFGVTRFGGYASHAVVPHDQLLRRPDSLSREEAAAFPAVHLTAWYALCDLVRVRPGAKVLVHSAAGGVGSALVGIAKRLGAFVVGVVGSSHKVDAVRTLGADAVIDKSREPLWARAEALASRGYDVVLDANGVETLGKSYEHLAPTGKLVVYGFHTMLPRGGGKPNYAKLAVDFVRTPRFSPLSLVNDNRAVLGFNLSYLFERKELLTEAMRELLAWRADGTLRAPTVTAFPFERVADAHRALESGNTIGKLVLTFTA